MKKESFQIPDTIPDEEKIMDCVDSLYQFGMYSMDFYSIPHDYGDGECLNIVEMHTLSMIAENPGLRVSDVAKLWHRTLGAASKNVDRLVKKGYVTKRKLKGNNKNIHLYPTETGCKLAELHKEYDQEQLRTSVFELLQHHTSEELLAFNNVIKTLTAQYEHKLLEMQKTAQTSGNKDGRRRFV